MNKLFEDSETFQKERPDSLTEEQLNNFCSEMAEGVNCSTDDKSEIANDIKDLYPSFMYDNGYALAKRLEDYGSADYDIDTEFCEWLDGLDYAYRRRVTENVKEWVKAHNVQPKYENGTKLLIMEDLNRKLTKDKEVYITGGRPEEAVYWINEYPNAYGGTVLAYELVEQRCKEIPKI